MAGDAPHPFVDQQTYAIIGAAMEVHRELWMRLPRKSLSGARLRIEFETRAIEFVNELPIRVQDKARLLPLGYRADFVCFDEVLGGGQSARRPRAC